MNSLCIEKFNKSGKLLLKDYFTDYEAYTSNQKYIQEFLSNVQIVPSKHLTTKNDNITDISHLFRSLHFDVALRSNVLYPFIINILEFYFKLVFTITEDALSNLEIRDFQTLLLQLFSSLKQSALQDSFYCTKKCRYFLKTLTNLKNYFRKLLDLDLSQTSNMNTFKIKVHSLALVAIKEMRNNFVKELNQCLPQSHSDYFSLLPADCIYYIVINFLSDLKDITSLGRTNKYMRAIIYSENLWRGLIKTRLGWNQIGHIIDTRIASKPDELVFIYKTFCTDYDRKPIIQKPLSLCCICNTLYWNCTLWGMSRHSCHGDNPYSEKFIGYYEFIQISHLLC